MLFVVHDFFQLQLFKKNLPGISFDSVSNSLEPDQAEHSVGPDLSLSCMQMLSGVNMPDLGSSCMQMLSTEDIRRKRVKL